jgi:hypothetical protein
VLLLFICAIVAAQTIPLAIPTTIVPPPNPAKPTAVFLIDYGKTPSLVLPVGDNRMVAYAYGDWAYYALRRQGPFDGIAALLWLTPGTLGRRVFLGPITAQTVRRTLDYEIEELLEFTVERADVDRLRAKLDRIREDHASTATLFYGMTFVRHPKSYTYWSNSNRVTAGWLRELGCKTRGPAFSSWWRVRSGA